MVCKLGNSVPADPRLLQVSKVGCAQWLRPGMLVVVKFGKLMNWWKGDPEWDGASKVKMRL